MTDTPEKWRKECRKAGRKKIRRGGGRREVRGKGSSIGGSATRVRGKDQKTR
jgi:hypothetical protein